MAFRVSEMPPRKKYAGAALAVALGGSVLMNVWLLKTRDVATPSVEQPSSIDRRSALPSIQVPSANGVENRPTNTAPADATEAMTDLDRSTLERQLADTRAELEKYRPIHERFEHGQRSTVNEARVQTFLDKAFMVNASAAQRPYAVECRDRICKVEPTDHATDWILLIKNASKMQTPGLFDFWSFGKGAAFLQLQDENVALGTQLVVRILAVLDESHAIADCQRANPASGQLLVKISLDTRARRLTVDAGGALAKQAGGICIQHALEAVIAATPIPDDLKSFSSWPIPFNLGPEPDMNDDTDF